MSLPSAWRARLLDGARTRVSLLTRRFGFDLTRFERGKLIKHHRITLVFDVGANMGQYAAELRALGYSGRIVSCEPLSDAFAKLSARAAGDPGWTTLRLAMGDKDGTATINVASNSQSSSLLAMMPRHLEAAPHTAYQGTEEVKVARLDTIFDQYVQPADRVLLKLDVQGYERFVLAGAEQSLPRVQGVQLEMSLVPLYSGESTYLDLIGQANAKGFELMSLEPALRDPRSGQLLAVDGLFFRP